MSLGWMIFKRRPIMIKIEATRYFDSISEKG